MKIDGDGLRKRGLPLVVGDWSYDEEWKIWQVKLIFQEDTKTRFKEHTVHAWIEERPSYCDRGRFQATCADNPNALNLDPADGFPRYYMHMAVALREMTDWLNWRLFQARTTPSPVTDTPP